MTTTRPWTAWKAVTVGSVSALVLSGCTFDIYSMPLPGGPDVGDNPMSITVEFADVLDLVPQSTVKVNDVTVGQVSSIAVDGYTAVAELEIDGDVHLPDNAVAQLRQTSLLGEKFVDLSAPEQNPSSNALEDGDRIPLARSGRNPEVEEVLGALSLLLNGGGVAQLKTITQELNNALEGREGAAKSVFRQLREFMGQLDNNKQDIIAAIESLNRLALSAERQLPTIDAALEELPSALRSIDRQRDDLIKMLRSLNELSDVAVGVIRASKASTIDALQQLSPVLNQLAASGDDFVKAFHVFLTYPFVDEVVGRDPQVARNLHMGDFTNLSITMDIELEGGEAPAPVDDLPEELDPVVIVDNVTKCLQSGDLDSRACKRVLASPQNLAELKERCQRPRNRDRDVCRELNTLDLGISSDGGLPGVSLPGLGTPRPGFGSPATADDSRGPTYGELMDAYDPALVKLLVPGMVTQ
jgi:phospholipid/cholesterol/gamma-HCH transport system substrate-binding protein